VLMVLVEPFDTSRRADTREAQMEKHILDPDLAEKELVEAGFEIVARDDDFILAQCEECMRADWLIAARVSSDLGGGKDNFPAGR
jgi:hypothetical protein